MAFEGGGTGFSSVDFNILSIDETAQLLKDLLTMFDSFDNRTQSADFILDSIIAFNAGGDLEYQETIIPER